MQKLQFKIEDGKNNLTEETLSELEKTLGSAYLKFLNIINLMSDGIGHASVSLEECEKPLNIEIVSFRKLLNAVKGKLESEPLDFVEYVCYNQIVNKDYEWNFEFINYTANDLLVYLENQMKVCGPHFPVFLPLSNFTHFNLFILVNDFKFNDGVLVLNGNLSIVAPGYMGLLTDANFRKNSIINLNPQEEIEGIVKTSEAN